MAKLASCCVTMKAMTQSRIRVERSQLLRLKCTSFQDDLGVASDGSRFQSWRPFETSTVDDALGFSRARHVV